MPQSESSEFKAPLQTPVAFLVFNRPDCTAQVFAAIRAARPPVLLIVADGPRPDRPGEAERCAAVRQIIEDGIDWPCRVLREYSETNLGCRLRVSSGITWVFEQVEEAIILEDDCLPHPTFFPYCEQLLQQYRDDERVMAISGDYFGKPVADGEPSYGFSRYPFIWGWASWRRAWRYYDVEMKAWPDFRESGLLAAVLKSPPLIEHWHRDFSHAHSGGLNTWDHQWTFACMSQGGLAITPRVNLVDNIGFGPDATHTDGDRWAPGHTPGGMSFPLCHPRFPLRDATADHAAEVQMMLPPSLSTRAVRKVGRIVRRLRAAASLSAPASRVHPQAVR